MFFKFQVGIMDNYDELCSGDRPGDIKQVPTTLVSIHETN